MITVTYKDKKATLNVDIEGHIAYFQFNTDDSLYARLIANAIRKELDNKIAGIREIAYNEGWSNKSSKKRKKKHFSTAIDTDYIGW